MEIDRCVRLERIRRGIRISGTSICLIPMTSRAVLISVRDDRTPIPIPTEMSASDESDLRQIAKTIAANIQFFVTNDSELLKKSEQVYERFGMNIIRPTDLIIHQDALIRETEYQSRMPLMNIQCLHSVVPAFARSNL